MAYRFSDTLLRIPLSLLLLALAALLGGCASDPAHSAKPSDDKVVVASNVVYDGDTGNMLDIYIPRGAIAAPTIVFLHGGRWTDGDKSEFAFVGQALARRGYMTVIPNLRKYPVVRFPAFVQDAAEVLRWVHQFIQAYGGDPGQLFLMGHSSGAHIAAMLAMDGQYLAAVEGGRDWLRGVIGLAGIYDFLPIHAPDLRDIFGPPEDFEKSQPVFFADGRNPPLLLLHGENDTVADAKNTKSLARTVRNAEGAVEVVMYQKLGHEEILQALSPRAAVQADVMDSIVDFVSRHFDKAPTEGIAGEALPEPEAMPEAYVLPPPVEPTLDLVPQLQNVPPPRAVPAPGSEVQAEPQPEAQISPQDSVLESPADREQNREPIPDGGLIFNEPAAEPAAQP